MIRIALVFALLLAACDSAEFERIRARAELNERIRNAVMPQQENSYVMVYWYRGHLIAKHVTPAVQVYQKGSPHVDVEPHVIAEKAEFLE